MLGIEYSVINKSGYKNLVDSGHLVEEKDNVLFNSTLEVCLFISTALDFGFKKQTEVKGDIYQSFS